MPHVTDAEIPFPPIDMMQLVCGKRVGEELVNTFINSGKLQVDRFEKINPAWSDVVLLDVGCGCGRFARALMKTEIASYTGFDRHMGLIQWAQQILLR